MSQPVSHSRGPSSDQPDSTALPQLPDQAIPRRSSSLRRKPVGGSTDRPKSRRAVPEDPKTTIAAANHGHLSVRPNTSSTPNYTAEEQEPQRSLSPESIVWPTNALRTPRHQPLAPNDPSPLNPAYYIPISSFNNGANTMPRNSEHVLLPAGFMPGKSEHTYVEEVMLPAVTHEVIKQHTTEIIQEEITREIHVHHYYTYTQPIKVIEILPARHFVIDSVTREKVEIQAPEGWVMPTNLQPYKPDIGGILAEQRHYLVDEAHPHGVPELEPLSFREKESELLPDREKKSGPIPVREKKPRSDMPNKSSRAAGKRS